MRDFPAGKKVSAQITAVEPYILHASLAQGIPAYITRPEALLTQKKTNLQESFKPGSSIDAIVIGYNTKYKSLELSIRQTLRDPWSDFVKDHSIGDKVAGEVILVTDNKALVEIEPGITAILPISEAWLRKERMEDILMVEDKIIAVISSINEEEKLIYLSVRDLFRDEVFDYKKATTYTLEDVSGDLLELIHYKESMDLSYDIGLKPATLKNIKRVIVLDDLDTVGEPLALMLDMLGFEAQFINTSGVSSREKPVPADLYIINLAAKLENRPLLDWLEQHLSNARILALAHADQLGLYAGRESSSGNSFNYLLMPAPEKQLAEALNIIAEGGKLEAPLVTASHWEVSAGQEADTISGKEPVEENLVALDHLLTTIKDFSGASLAVVFQFDLNNNDVTILKATDPELTLSSFDIGHLQFSPVRDVIFENLVFKEGEGATKLKYLECLGQYESAMGLKIDFIDRNAYCLFLFGKEKNKFQKLSKVDLNIYELALRTALEKQNMEKNMLSMQKFIVSGRITFSLMHETKNQIQALNSWLQILKSNSVRLNRKEIKANDETFLARYQRAVDGAIAVEKNITQIEELFLNLLREQNLRTVSLERVIEELVKSLSAYAKELKIRVEFESDKVPIIQVNVAALSQILTNLFINSYDFIPTVRKISGRIKVNLKFEKERQRPIVITYWDNGPGVHYKDREKIFNMFYTTKPEGTGLGLYISRNLAKSMGGVLYLKDSYRLSESTFVLELPFEPIGGE